MVMCMHDEGTVAGCLQCRPQLIVATGGRTRETFQSRKWERHITTRVCWYIEHRLCAVCGPVLRKLSGLAAAASAPKDWRDDL